MTIEQYKLFYQNIDITQYRSILVLNGDLPDQSFFNIGLPIIAADGALNTLHTFGITPRAVVGDLDSVQQDLLNGIETVYVPDQDSCDFEKALIYLKNKDLLPSIIVGIHGGFIDHILNNINIFLQHGCIFYTGSILGYILSEGQIQSFSLSIDTKISLMGFPHAIVSSHGLKWELTRYSMSFPGPNSSFNRTCLDVTSIEVHHGLVLVMIYCV